MNLFKLFVCILFLNFLALSLSAQDKPIVDACPVLSVIEPAAAVEAGENLIFTAEVKGGSSDIIYSWTVDQGEIINGQGTPTITVSTKGLENETVNASVSISGGFLDECKSEASGAGVVTSKPKPVLVDKFVRGNCEDLLARMDGFFVQLQNNPTAQGYILINGKRRATEVALRESRNWIKMRGFSPDRITFVLDIGFSERAELEMYLVPPGAEPPEPQPQTEQPPEPEKPEPEPADPNEPYIFSSEYYDGVAGCGDIEELDLEGYAKILKENPKSRGNVVIMVMTKAEYREKEKEILMFLTSKGIARKRLRIFHEKTFGGVELWFLP